MARQKTEAVATSLSGAAHPVDLDIDESRMLKGLECFKSHSHAFELCVDMLQAGVASGKLSKRKKKKIENLLETYGLIGDILSKATIDYLENCYEDMWNVSSYLTGNLRASLGIIGDVYNDPLGAEIGIVMSKLLEPKVLFNLRAVTYTRVYHCTVKGQETGEVRTYQYDYEPYTLKLNRPSGANYYLKQEDVNITSRQEVGGQRVGGPFIYTVWEEIRKKYREEYRVKRQSSGEGTA